MTGLVKSVENIDLNPKGKDTKTQKSETPDSSQTASTKRRSIPEIDGKRVMLVAAKSRVKQVAGSIARTIREEDSQGPPVLSAVGAASVNQAVKSIAIARGFLADDNIDLAVEVSKRPQEQVKDVIIFTLTQHSKGTLLSGDEENINFQEMRSAATSTPGALAGAIANNVRNKKNPRITAIGMKPVFKAIVAVCIARNYLRRNNIDLDIVPRFTTVKFDNGNEANAVQLIVLSRDADSDGEECEN
eukprot:snap_masked-scaffold_50-processed-gene-0.26-mRNA-1 protein AED:0.12 eAED:0.12 QI:0/-1/0/1/-1/1/1/0/244